MEGNTGSPSLEQEVKGTKRKLREVGEDAAGAACKGGTVLEATSAML